MTFSATTKASLLRVLPEKPCCMLSELSALLFACGSLRLMGAGRVSVRFETENPALARRLYLLIKRRLSVSPKMHFVKRARLYERRVCVLTLDGADARALLTALGMMAQDATGADRLVSTAPRSTVRKRCCASAFLRAAFIGAGSVQDPERAYHMEIVTRQDAFVRALQTVSRRAGARARVTERRGARVTYWKSAEDICALLALMGAHAAVTTTQSVRVQKQVKNQVNRALNCDGFNLEKVLEASDRQLAAMRALVAYVGADGLPDKLAAVVRAREAAPEASMQELADALGISKSGVHHRLLRIEEMARALKEDPS